jgi:hypothetical protein
MPRSESTLLNYLNSNSNDCDSREFVQLLKDFLKLNYPDLEFYIIQHIYAPECYKLSFAEEHGRKYVEILRNESNKEFSKMGGFLKFGNLLISPLTDCMNQVKFLIVIDSCPVNIFEELSTIVREAKETFRFVSSQLESYSRSINLKTANLVSQISHDLNSLIALIPKEFAKDKTLNARIKYSGVLSREIMFYLRDLSVEKSNVPVRELLTAITSVISIPENVDFNLKFIDEFNSLTVDVDLIDRALSAILKNAVFATGLDGGKIDMVVGKRKNVSPFIEYDWLQVIVTDTGPGIAKEFLESVKNPFFTTWKDQGHAGLGLAIADKIIRAHNGYLDIESIPDAGATLSIHLPLS